MDREELKSKVTDKLGSTRLTAITDETINHQLDFALGFVSDDTMVDDAFVERVAANLKNIDGGSHKLIGSRINEYKAQHPATVETKVPEPTPAPKVEDGEPEWLKAFSEKVDARFKKMEEAAAAESLKATKNAAREQVVRGFRKKFKDSGLEVNDFLLETTMRDIEIPAKNIDINSLISATETKYTEYAKKLDIDVDFSHGGQGSGGGGKSKTDLRFEAKKRRQANQKQ